MGVVRLDITRREPVAAAAGYEKIDGVLHFTADPAARQNEPIADLGLAPRNARGRVEFSADFYVLKPVDARKATAGCSSTCRTAAARSRSASSTARRACPIRAARRISATAS